MDKSDERSPVIQKVYLNIIP